MQDAQGSIAKDTAAVCAATVLLVVLLVGAAILWQTPPVGGPQSRFQVQTEMAHPSPHRPRAYVPIETAAATPLAATNLFVF